MHENSYYIASEGRRLLPIPGGPGAPCGDLAKTLRSWFVARWKPLGFTVEMVVRVPFHLPAVLKQPTKPH